MYKDLLESDPASVADRAAGIGSRVIETDSPRSASSVARLLSFGLAVALMIEVAAYHPLAFWIARSMFGIQEDTG
ncbi:MAG TPA: hypothetical protein VMR54_00400 [Thermoanaerobaculia bacterium]|nr:hypothetical protein [Thermoanaerobaculia bacterium]